jgi:hypothetical protein
MARVADLVTPDKDAELWHPIIGRVSWKDTHNVYARYLTHSIGPEKGRLLYPDWEVLTNDRWELYTNQDAE